jgi:Family of unknown function (DUF6166)
VVTVDGAPLDPRFDIKCFSRTGFEWTYVGDGPRQLALALLADHLGDERRALALTEGFMRAVVAEFDNAWRMTSDEIAAAVDQLEAAFNAASPRLSDQSGHVQLTMSGGSAPSA